VLAALEVQDFRRQEFERAQQLAGALEQQGGIGSGKLDEYSGCSHSRSCAIEIDGNAVLELEAAVRDYGLQKFANLFRSCNLSVIGIGKVSVSVLSQASGFTDG